MVSNNPESLANVQTGPASRRCFRRDGPDQEGARGAALQPSSSTAWLPVGDRAHANGQQACCAEQELPMTGPGSGFIHLQLAAAECHVDQAVDGDQDRAGNEEPAQCDPVHGSSALLNASALVSTRYGFRRRSETNLIPRQLSAVVTALGRWPHRWSRKPMPMVSGAEGAGEQRATRTGRGLGED